MRIYDKLFKPLGYKVFPRNIFYKGNPYLDLYYDKLGLDWFGEFKVSRKTYITSFGAKTKSPEELIKLIEEYNKTRICPSYCYCPTATNWANIDNAFRWYLQSLGFVSDDSIFSCNTSMILENLYGEPIIKLSLYCKDDGSGDIVRHLKGFSWIEAKFNGVDSMISAVNSILEPELLVNATNNIDAANNMTKGRTDVEASVIDNYLNIYKVNTKNAVKQALQEALNKLN